MLFWVRNIAAIILILNLCSCGYKWGNGGTLSPSQTISVPYVDGDWNGELTAALIKQLSQSGTHRYCSSGGSLLLKVNVIESYTDNIGFRYDHNKAGRVKKSVIPDETRVTILVEVVVIEVATGNKLLGPVRLTEEADFDHDYYTSRNGVNVFSLGQLTDYDEAYDAVQRPLNQRLAQKIVDYINDNW